MNFVKGIIIGILWSTVKLDSLFAKEFWIIRKNRNFLVERLIDRIDLIIVLVLDTLESLKQAFYRWSVSIVRKK